MEYVEAKGEEKGENKLLKERLKREQQEAAIRQKMEDDARRLAADQSAGQGDGEPQAVALETPDQPLPVVQQAPVAALQPPSEFSELAMTISAQITASLQETLAANSAAVAGLQNTTTDGFNRLNNSVNSIGNRVTKCETKINKLDDDQAKCMQIQLKTRELVGKHSGTLERLTNESINHASNISEIQQNLSDFSERMINLEDIIKQYQAGKLGVFSPDEAPNLKDHYDLKVQFNKSKHGIGYFPIFRDHIEAIKVSQNCSLADAYRICVSEYLQMEMAFEERFVIELEKHVVEIIYNGVDTIFVIYDDIKLSGAKRVWQESHQLWARQTGDVATDPSLKKLEVPQFALRMEALKDFANSLRWKWRRENEAAWEGGARCRTRVLEAIDSFDYIVQMKRPEDEDFKKVDWPAGRELPKIDWKRKTYTQYSEIAMFPKNLSDIVRKDAKKNPPQGRRIPPVYTGKKQLNRWEDISVISLKPNHQYVPGLIDPDHDKTISQGAGLTDWIQMQQTGKDPALTRQIPKPSELGLHQSRPRSSSLGQPSRASSLGAIPKTTGAIINPNDLREPDLTDLEKKQKEEAEAYEEMVRKLDEESKRRREELAKREEEENRKIAEMEERIRRAAERRLEIQNLTPEEQLKRLEEATREREQQEEEAKEREEIEAKEREENWKKVAAMGRNFYPQNLMPKDTCQEAPSSEVNQEESGGNEVNPQETGGQETEPDEGMDTDIVRTEEQLEDEMSKLHEENAQKEKERWEAEEKARLEAEEKAKLEAEKEAKDKAEAGAGPEAEKSQSGLWSYLSKVGQMAGMVTSTQIDQSDLSSQGAAGGQTLEAKNDDPILAGSKTPSSKKQIPKGQPSITSFLSKQSSTLTDSHFQDSENESEASEFMTPTGSPNSTVMLRASPENSPNRTQPLDVSLNATQPLPTPSSISPSTIRKFNDKYHELVKITPAGGNKNVTVRSRKDQGVTKLPRLQIKTQEDRARSAGLKKRWPTPPRERTSSLTFGKIGKSASRKRTVSQDKSADSKKDRVNSPEKEADKVEGTGEDETKAEDVTAESDDLSSLSILPVAEGEADAGAAAGESSEVNTAESGSEVNAEDSASGDVTVIANVKQEEADAEDKEAETGGATGEDNLDDTLILPPDEQLGAKPRVTIVKDYVETHQSPDKVPTPPPDKTGHIAGVQSMTRHGKINSEINQEPLTPGTQVKQNFKALVDATNNMEAPSTAEKKAKKEEID